MRDFSGSNVDAGNGGTVSTASSYDRKYPMSSSDVPNIHPEAAVVECDVLGNDIGNLQSHSGSSEIDK